MIEGSSGPLHDKTHEDSAGDAIRVAGATGHENPASRDARATLRWRLRQDTRDEHEALDAMLADCDVATAPGLAAFLAVQADALARLAPICADGATRRFVIDLLAAARTDLRALGVVDPEPAGTDTATSAFDGVPAPRMLDPLAVDYVIFGSRLGNTVMHRHWSATADPAARQAGRFLSLPVPADGWRGLTARLSAMPATGVDADRTICDARAVFALYGRAAVARRAEVYRASA
ncbi:hypothetical protein EKE94_05920 [Mesobaculum littorinae]|uniref:Heme oxygenase n=1 Tax=Mesobaculum littorinae TaxID=2486419 RepID=A0A438AIK0_9RHOB|nr:biliverdin-producing heme oxygenase [Mesobaculum littorinae]RVV98455.1 hypothetical protein EKE94_05920 [Mesobaculum littorinae]